MNNQQGTPVKQELVLIEYKNELNRANEDAILLRAYVRQLQDELSNIKSELDEANAKLKFSENTEAISTTKFDKNKK